MFKYHQEKGDISGWNFTGFVHLQLLNLCDRNDNRMFSSSNSGVVLMEPFTVSFETGSCLLLCPVQIESVFFLVPAENNSYTVQVQKKGPQKTSG